MLAAAADLAFRARGGRAVCAPAVVGLRSFADASFDVATLRSYLEHEHDPLAVLRAVRSLLNRSGVAFVKVPNYGSLNRRVRGARWCGYRHPEHVNYFTARTLRARAAMAGFKSRIGLTDAFPTSDNLWARLAPA